jgi:N-methylhydantoinase A
VLLGVDVGGTFTDAVLALDGRLVTAKAPTTPDDQSEGVLAAVGAALERAGARAQDVEAFAHGMTVATNALLEGRAARTVLAVTEGFTDVVELGRQARADLYRLCAAHPAPLVPAQRRVAVPERTGPQGPLRALDTEAADAVAQRVGALEPEAIAVCLLHSDRHPEHERALGQALARRLPGVHVSLSHEVVGTFREFERFATTEIDAALSPLLAAYLRRLRGRAEDAGLPAPLVMQSSGGLADADRAARHAALTVLSGPAGGASAAALLAARSGREDLLCFDMGGTSCDVCVVEGGAVRETAGREVGGRPLALPMVDVHTVGAGGGSIAWRDAGGALRAGPHSAGADPGPACYGRGGTQPTVTDANLVLGRLDEGSPLAGDVALDRAAAERAVGGLAQGLGIDLLACAEGIVRVTNAEMLRALRVMTVEQGIDPRAFALLAFGGAGGLHAAALAVELGMDTVLCPRAGGVLSALGLAAADRRATAQRTVLMREPSAEEVAEAIDGLGEEAQRELGGSAASARRSAVLELRYAGQAHELAVRDPEVGEVRERFEALHEERYGYRDERATVELVTARVTASLPGADLTWTVEGEPAQRSRRTVVFDGAQHDAHVARGEPAPGEALGGPGIWELPEATVAVPPGWRAQADALGTLVLERAR